MNIDFTRLISGKLKYKTNKNEEFQGIIEGIAAPVDQITDDSRKIKFAYEFLESNLKKTVPFYTDHEQTSKTIIGKAIFNKIDQNFLYFKGNLYLKNLAFIEEPLKDGILSGVSVGLANIVWGEDKKGIVTITKGDIIDLSLTPSPAYSSAKITQIFNAQNNTDYENLELEKITNLSDIEKFLKKYGINNKESKTIISLIYKLKNNLIRDELDYDKLRDEALELYQKEEIEKLIVKLKKF